MYFIWKPFFFSLFESFFPYIESHVLLQFNVMFHLLQDATLYLTYAWTVLLELGIVFVDLEKEFGLRH